jgi:hypothetical protein
MSAIFIAAAETAGVDLQILFGVMGDPRREPMSNPDLSGLQVIIIARKTPLRLLLQEARAAG